MSGTASDSCDVRSTNRSGGDLIDVVPHLGAYRVDLVEDLSRPLLQVPTCRCELDPTGAAVEQRHADLLLEASDLHAERRLRHVQPLRGATEMKLLGDGHEITQLTKLHEGTIRGSCYRVVTRGLRANRNEYRWEIGFELGLSERSLGPSTTSI